MDPITKTSNVLVAIFTVIIAIALCFLVLWLGCEVGRFIYDVFGAGGLAGFCTFLLCGAIASNRA